MDMNQQKNNNIIVLIIGILVGGLVFSSITMWFVNSNINKIIDDKLGGSSQTTLVGGSSNLTRESSNTEKIAAKSTPAVVGVETVELTSGMLGNEYESTGIGTGVIVDKSGIIVTNQHVVSNNPKKITVTLIDGSSYDAKILYTSDVIDLAFIKIKAKGRLTVAALGDSDSLNVGQEAIAIGNPLGLTFERTVTRGIVSALNRSMAIDESTIAEDLIQTDASINSGNSGGPLINSKGEVIGINTYKIQSGEGLGFAIPINIAKPILAHLVEDGKFTPTVIGISGVDKEISRYVTAEDVTIEKGVLVTSVAKGSGAANAGIQKNDVITKINDKEINTMLAMREQLYWGKPGGTVKVTYERNGTAKTVDVKLSAQR